METLRPMDLAGILDAAFRLFWRNAWFLMGLAVFFVVPVAILGLLLEGRPAFASPSPPPTYFLFQAIVLLLTLLAQFASVLSMVRGAGRLYRGQPVTISACLLPAILWTVPYLLLYLILTPLIVIATLLFVVPGLVLAALFYLFMPALLLENRGYFMALQRAVKLAWGALPRLVGVMTLGFLMRLSGTLLLMLLLLVPSFVLVPRLAMGSPLLSMLVLPVEVPILAFQACVTVVAYYDRRVSWEGLDLEDRLEALEAAP